MFHTYRLDVQSAAQHRHKFSVLENAGRACEECGTAARTQPACPVAARLPQGPRWASPPRLAPCPAADSAPSESGSPTRESPALRPKQPALFSSFCMQGAENTTHVGLAAEAV